MSSSTEFIPTEVPARLANLAFSYLRPADFKVVPLPEEESNFEDPTVFVPLQVVMAGYGAVLFSVAARPAYGDGSVEDWAHFLASKDKVDIVSLRPGTFAGLPAILVEALQPTDAGKMRIRSAMLEDGMRFLNISVLAPDAIWDSVQATLHTTMTSFRLAESKGTTTPLTRAEVKKVDTIAAAPTAPDASDAGKSDTAAAYKSPLDPAKLALAEDAATLDPEHPMNVRLRNSRAGLTPRVLEVNQAEKYALIGAGAIAATFRVPLGWHVIDDGKRTLVFDAAGQIQISVNLRRDDGDHRALLDQIEAQTRQEQPEIDPLRIDFTADMPGLVLRNYHDGKDVLVQAFIVKQLRDDGLSHVVRVTAAPSEMSRAMNLAEIILRSLGQQEQAAAR